MNTFTNQRRSKSNLPRFATLVLFALGLLGWASAYAENTLPPNTSPPNIVVILVDDMGYGDPGCYNRNSKIPTPNIDALAADGMRFTDAHAPGPLCHLSRYGLLTGRYPFRTQFPWRRRPVIDEDQVTIPSLLRSQGYRTAMVGKWHLGFVEEANESYGGPLRGGPADRGFDSFFGIRASTDIPPYFYIRDRKAVEPPTDRIDENHTSGWTDIQGEFWRAGRIAPSMRLADVLPRFTDEAIAVIDQHADSSQSRKQPLFLYLAYPAPHTPWLPSEDFVGRSQASLYGDFAHMVDAMIGRVLATLEARQLHQNTLVIFTSDNGPVWYDSDVERFDHDSSGGLRGMKADAWECGHRMPFIARWPGRIAAGSVTEQTICFTDLMATFARLNNVELPAGAGPDSFDISPVLLGLHPPDQPIRGPIVMKSGSGFMTVREGPWKYIEGLGSGGFSRPKRVAPTADGPQGQLYHLLNDPGEIDNQFSLRPDVVARLKQQLHTIEHSQQTRP